MLKIFKGVNVLLSLVKVLCGEGEKKVSIEPYLDRFQWMKKGRMKYIVQELENRGGEAPLKQFMGSIATEHGISYETQKKYFAELEDYGLIEISEGKIRLKKKELPPELEK